MPETTAATYLDLMTEIQGGKSGKGGKGKKSVVRRNDR